MVRNTWFIYPAEHIFNLVSPNSTIEGFFSKVIIPDMLVVFESIYNRISYNYNSWFVCFYLLHMMWTLFDTALLW